MPIPGFLGPAEKIAASPRLGTRAGTHFEPMIAGRTASRSKDLAFRVEQQTQTQWCWAAVASSTSKFYDPASPWTQCAVANAQLAKTVCCDPEAAAGQCNTPSRLDQALARTSNFVRYVIQSEQGPEPVVSFDDIRSEIDRGRVVATRVGWSDNSGHFQAIFGYVESASGRQFIRVTDPIYREVDIVFSDFASRYAGGGWWNVAYFTGPATEVVAGGAGTPGMAMAENAMPASESDLMGA